MQVYAVVVYRPFLTDVNQDSATFGFFGTLCRSIIAKLGKPSSVVAVSGIFIASHDSVTQINCVKCPHDEVFTKACNLSLQRNPDLKVKIKIFELALLIRAI